MENEIRYYLKKTLEIEESRLSYLITAVKLPTGAIEIAINTSNIMEKIKYILEAYDEEMRLKTNLDVFMQNIMIV